MKLYTKPEIEISVFATEDIITASNIGDDPTVTTPPALSPGEDPNTGAVGTYGIDYNNVTWTNY